MNIPERYLCRCELVYKGGKGVRESKSMFTIYWIGIIRFVKVKGIEK